MSRKLKWFGFVWECLVYRIILKNWQALAKLQLHLNLRSTLHISAVSAYLWRACHRRSSVGYLKERKKDIIDVKNVYFLSFTVCISQYQLVRSHKYASSLGSIRCSPAHSPPRTYLQSHSKYQPSTLSIIELYLEFRSQHSPVRSQNWEEFSSSGGRQPWHFWVCT